MNFLKVKGPYPCQDERGCPERKNVPTELFCPAWYEGRPDGAQLIETNPATGEKRVVRGCWFDVMPSIMQWQYQEQASNTAETSALRHEIRVEIRETVRQVVGEAFGEVFNRIDRLAAEEKEELPKLPDMKK